MFSKRRWMRRSPSTSATTSTISRMTDKVVGEMVESRNRPLDRVYQVMFTDAVHVKIRDGQGTNRPMHVVIGVNGERDIRPPGFWAGEGGEVTVNRILRDVGRAVPGDRADVGERVERVRSIPGLRRGDQAGDLLDRCHRVRQRPIQACCAGSWALPDRAGRPRMPVARHACTEPRQGKIRTVGNQVEASARRVRDHPRRTHHPER